MSTVAQAAPAPGLIAKLTVRTWLDFTADGRMFVPMLITYPAPQFEDVDPVRVEQDMLGVAAALATTPTELDMLGGGAPAHAGRRVHLTDNGLLLVRFDGTPWALRVAKAPRWSRLVAELGHVLLAVGLDELSAVASRAEVDEYIERAGRTGRIHAAVADVVNARGGPTLAVPRS
ncbi:hypothetical protein [Streptomyces sp. NPDC014685]|uniref:hypothetical protein n=1 Tax=Streptomyces sp. NPDC014685 TaxID=3364881 RepID=UPI0036F993A8